MRNFRAITVPFFAAFTLVAIGGARADTIACRTLRGPCQLLDTLAVLLPASGGPVLVANFGIIAPDSSGQWRYACEAGLGALAARARLAPSGEILVGSDQGLVRYRPGCAPAPAIAAIPGGAVLDVAFDARDQRRLRVLGASPRALYESSDAGAHFAPLAAFGEAGVFQLAVAPSRPDVIYAAGEAPGGRLLLLRSDDGGRTFSARPPEVSPEGLPLGLGGIDPLNAEILFAVVRAPDGADALWRSANGGQSWAPALSLPAPQTFSGLAFGGSGGATVFVASRQPFAAPGEAPAYLHVSRDGGRTFAPGVPSLAGGPRYRCLGFRAGVLYACAGGRPDGDAFLLGASSDEGRSWTPVVTTESLAGPEPCLAPACAETTRWLCDSYGACPRDAGTGTGTGASAGAGCGCRVAGRSRPGAVVLVLLALARCRRGQRPSITNWRSTNRR